MMIELSQTPNNSSLYDLISETNTKDLETKLNNNKLTLKNWGNKNNTILIDDSPHTMRADLDNELILLIDKLKLRLK
mgnify:CR=1 FL=1